MTERMSGPGHLGEFLTAIKQGLIEPDSYLLIENLDRLSRNKPRKALQLLEQICDAGVTVVTTADGRGVRRGHAR